MMRTTVTGAQALARAGARRQSSSRQRRGWRSSTGRRHPPLSSRSRWRAPNGSPAPPTSRLPCRSTPCAGSLHPFEARIHTPRPFAGQLDSAANLLTLLDRKRDQPFARRLRRGTGRVLAPLRAPGARRRARCARASCGGWSRQRPMPRPTTRWSSPTPARSCPAATSTARRWPSRPTCWRSPSPSSPPSASGAPSGCRRRSSAACLPSSPRAGGLHSGLMLAQVTAAALTSELKTLAHPASVDTIPTSANKEDHVSMSMGAALKASRAVDARHRRRRRSSRCARARRSTCCGRSPRLPRWQGSWRVCVEDVSVLDDDRPLRETSAPSQTLDCQRQRVRTRQVFAVK